MTDDELVRAAGKAREKAYVPYLKFPVGAALLCEDGQVFTGCNVENLSFGLTICAERNAVAAAVGAGVQKFIRIAVVAGSADPVSPCGACRQVLAEFDPELPLISRNLQGQEFGRRWISFFQGRARGFLDRKFHVEQ